MLRRAGLVELMSTMCRQLNRFRGCAFIDKMATSNGRSTLSSTRRGLGLVKHTVAQMKAQPRTGSAAGHIVLISSTSGQRGEAFHCDYSASKGALISMTKSLPQNWSRLESM